MIICMKKFIASAFILSILSLWITLSQSISLSPQWEWTFWNGCIVPIDVYVDTKGQEISAMDLMMESSLDYKDFVPSDMFPYFFKPIIESNWLIHVVWFTVDPSERVVWSWKIWTLYFSQKEWANDWIIRLYFLWEWETIDTNLSIAWWVDVLKEVWTAFVEFSTNLPSCEDNTQSNDSIKGQNNSVSISWWFWDLSYEEVLDQTMKKIDKDYGKTSFLDVLKKNIFIVIFLLIIIIILLVRAILSFEKESNKWEKK